MIVLIEYKAVALGLHFNCNFCNLAGDKLRNFPMKYYIYKKHSFITPLVSN